MPLQSLRLRVTPRIPPLQIELRNTGAAVQWRLGKTGDWHDLIALAELTTSVEVGAVTTANPGQPATVENVGTEANVVLDFAIPKGDTGDAATVEVGSVDTVEPDEPASVTNVGTSSAVVLNFSLPRGNDSTVEGPSVADGAKGDVTVSGSGSVWTVAPGVIDNDKLAAMAQATLKGRGVGTGSGDPVDLSAAAISAIIGANGQFPFPATANPSADPNTLDDYEEGLWTPALTFGNASVGLTYYATYGRYTKVGRTVSVMGMIQLTAKGSSTGAARLAGLPFLSQGTIFGTPASIGYYSALASMTGPPMGSVYDGSSLIELYHGGGNSVSVLTATNFTNNTQLMFGATYDVA